MGQDQTFRMVRFIAKALSSWGCGRDDAWRSGRGNI